MKTGTIALIALGAGALYLFNLAQAANVVQVVLSGVNIQSLTNWNITFMVQNVSNANIVINSMSGVVNVNGVQIANISAFPPGGITVPPNQQVPINVQFSPSPLSIPAAVMSILNAPTGNSQIPINAVGNINLGGLILPFNLSQNVVY
jgi:hypothetical protein